MTDHHSSKRGMTGLELAVVLAVIGVASVGGYYWLRLGREDAAAARLAADMERYSDAAQDYVLSNRATVENLAIAAGGITTLANGSFSTLTPGYTTQTLSEQTFCTVVVRTGANQLQVISTTTGGSAIEESVLADYVTKLPDRGGYISPDAPTIIRGRGGAYSLTAASYSATGCVAQAGRPFAYRYVAAETNGSQALMRFTQPGIANTGRMSQDLDLGGCDDPATATVETTAACTLKNAGTIGFLGLAGSESGFDIARMRLINSLMAGQYPATYNSGNFAFAGDLTANDFIFATSDASMKADFTPISSADVDALLSTHSYRYTRIDTGRRSIGFIANEFAARFPEITQVHPVSGKLTMDYTKVVPIAIAALRQQRTTITLLGSAIGTCAAVILALLWSNYRLARRLARLEQHLPAA